jgi:hypothetical protein
MEMKKERKPFQELPGSQNPQFMEDGRRIFNEMRKKYPKNNDEDLDNILNGLCASLLCLIRQHVDKGDHMQFLQLIYKILHNSISKK